VKSKRTLLSSALSADERIEDDRHGKLLETALATNASEG
jgi:hypothetical protein